MEIIGLISFASSTIALIISLYLSFNSSVVNRLNKFNDNIADMNKITIDHPELDCLFNNEKLEDKREDTKFFSRMSAFIYLHLNMLENVYYQVLTKKGLSVKYHKEAWRNYIKLMFKTKLVVEIWEANKNLYDRKFTIYVDKLLCENKLSV